MHRYFSAGVMLLWVAEKIHRSLQMAVCHEVDILQWHSQSTSTLVKLHPKDTDDYEPGQYFFVNIPALSLSEWHPITASASLDGGLTFYIKESAPRRDTKGKSTTAGLLYTQSWTVRLGALAKCHPTNVNVSAPVAVKPASTIINGPSMLTTFPTANTQHAQFNNTQLASGRMASLGVQRAAGPTQSAWSQFDRFGIPSDTSSLHPSLECFPLHVPSIDPRQTPGHSRDHCGADVSNFSPGASQGREWCATVSGGVSGGRIDPAGDSASANVSLNIEKVEEKDAEDADLLQTVRVRVHGPFGHFDATQHQGLLLVAGGIGITPMIAIFTHLQNLVRQGQSVGLLRRVVLVWMSRRVSEFHLFEDIFESMQTAGGMGYAPAEAAPSRNTHAHAALSPLSEESATDEQGEATTSKVPDISALPGTVTITTTAPESTTGKTDSPQPPIAARRARPSLLRQASAFSLSPRSPNGTAPCRFELRLHCTRRESHAVLTNPTSSDFVSPYIVSGRVNMPALFDEFRCLDTLDVDHRAKTLPVTVNTSSPARVLAAVCGPRPLALEVSQKAWERKFDFHTEQFEF
jgi:hypothetical protein